MKEKSFDEWLLNKYLIEEEKVLWTGKPNSKRPIIIFLFIFLIPVFFYFIDKVQSNGSHFYVYFFITIFCLIYTYIRLQNKKDIWESTIYAITDKRILVVTGGNDKIIEKRINNITCVKIEEKKQGIGTIVFGNIPIPSLYYSKSSRNEHALKYSFDGNIPIFNEINDARKVYKLVNDLRNNLV